LGISDKNYTSLENLPLSLYVTQISHYMLLKFSFLLNVGLHIWYLTISPSSESLSLEWGQMTHYLNLYGTRFPETSVKKTFYLGVKLYSLEPQTIGSDTTCWKNMMVETSGRQTRMRPKTLRLFGLKVMSFLSQSGSWWEQRSNREN